MQKKFLILIAERNPHIRNLVRRELVAEGYDVFTVENVLQLKNWFSLRREPDVLVLDPELSGNEEHNIWELLETYPQLPVIIYCLCPDQWIGMRGPNRSALVEKNGNSITFLKHQIERIGNKN